ncbi:unnamed protein product [Cylicocyclus nassatus]|uniref:Uncharacterized protein n=1 Tax=Cylicocyclus nassatus TaxID=53992 RepID=A0AA36H0X1_CYLNA|nr:unnamed protein product [Cylicocyclus nassatus]
MEEVLVNETPYLCSRVHKDFYWFHSQPKYNESLPEYITKEMLSEIENEEPTNITKEGVSYDDSAAKYGLYPLNDYLNLVRASTRKFACIIVSGRCNGYDTSIPLLFCGTDKPHTVGQLQLEYKYKKNGSSSSIERLRQELSA